MTNKNIYIAIGIIIIVALVGIFTISIPEKEEFYDMSITGLNEEYTVDEDVNLSVILSGFGGLCGSFEAELVKEGKNTQLVYDILECSGSTKTNFSYTLLDDFSLKDNFHLNETGSYFLKMQFDPTFGNTPTVYLEKTFEVIEN